MGSERARERQREGEGGRGVFFGLIIRREALVNTVTTGEIKGRRGKYRHCEVVLEGQR